MYNLTLMRARVTTVTVAMQEVLRILGVRL